MPPVDLRSDTLTRPTPGMREAMAAAEVGDDVYGEDPTVNALEAEVAALFGHEAALFVPSGTMGNQLAVRLLVPPADELLLDADAHVVTYEGGAAAQLGGIQTRTIVSERGLLDPRQVRRQVREPGFTVPTRAVAVEQTHNRGGGTVYPLGLLREVRAVCDDTGTALHCDGARIWNASVATGVGLDTYGALFETLSVCLSKGLGAPVGSVLVTSASRIAEARVVRRRLGGAMRQAGILAAAGRYALAHHIDRLADDHARARRLADRLGGVLPVEPPETNIVQLDLAGTGLSAAEVQERAAAEGVRVGAMSATVVRLVTHLGVDDAGVERAADVLSDLL